MTRAKDISKILTDADFSGTLDVTGDLTVDTNTLKVDSSNNRVGIGTSSPAHELHIVGADDTRGIITSGGTGDSVFMFENASGNTWGHGLDLSSGNYAIAYNASGDPSLTGDGLFNITSSGNVGIGISSPTSYPIASDLVIDTGTNGGITIKSGTSNYGGVFFADGTTGDQQYRGFVQYNHNYASSTDELLLGTAGAERMKIDQYGHVTMPYQPAFMVHPSTTQSNSNIPVNGFTTIVFGTERFDQNGDFASNTFTAPVTGKYQLQVSMRLDSLDTDNNNIQLHITTSNRTYYSIIQPTVLAADPAFWWLGVTVLADMDASDTAYVRIYISNDGAAQIDVAADSYFSGYLVA